jgi:hypothetical protein
MFSVVVYGLPLDKPKVERDKFAKVIRNSIIWVRQSKLHESDISVHFPFDLDSFDQANGITVSIFNRVNNPILVLKDYAMIRRVLSKELSRLLPGAKISIHFS